MQVLGVANTLVEDADADSGVAHGVITQWSPHTFGNVNCSTFIQNAEWSLDGVPMADTVLWMHLLKHNWVWEMQNISISISTPSSSSTPETQTTRIENPSTWEEALANFRSSQRDNNTDFGHSVDKRLVINGDHNTSLICLSHQVADDFARQTATILNDDLSTETETTKTNVWKCGNVLYKHLPEGKVDIQIVQ